MILWFFCLCFFLFFLILSTGVLHVCVHCWGAVRAFQTWLLLFCCHLYLLLKWVLCKEINLMMVMIKGGNGGTRGARKEGMIEKRGGTPETIGPHFWERCCATVPSFKCHEFMDLYYVGRTPDGVISNWAASDRLPGRNRLLTCVLSNFVVSKYFNVQGAPKIAVYFEAL